MDVNAYIKATRKPQTTHRSAIVTADKVVSPTHTAADSGTSGSLTAVNHGACVAAGNAYGSAGAGNITSTLITVSKSIDLTIPQSAGATYYDIFVSTSTTAPLWVARVTEAQRAAGCAVTAVATVGAGGSVGVVNVRVVGTGIACTNAVFAQNNAYTPTIPTAISTVVYNKIYLDVSLALTDLRSAPTLTIIPFSSYDDTTWYQGQRQVLQPLTAGGYSLYQQFVFGVDGAQYMVFLIDGITGQGAAATIKYQLV